MVSAKRKIDIFIVNIMAGEILSNCGSISFLIHENISHLGQTHDAHSDADTEQH